MVLAQARTLRNLALVYYQTGERSKATVAITDSFNTLKQLERNTESTKALAQIVEVKGQLELSTGNSEEALEIWKQASEKYKEIGDATGVIRNNINQAKTLQLLGLYSRAIKTLKAVKETLQNQPNSVLKARGLQSLGEALRVAGDLNQSQEVLQQSLAIAEKLPSREALTAATKKPKPMAGFEPATDRLRIGYSTTELHRHRPFIIITQIQRRRQEKQSCQLPPQTPKRSTPHLSE